METVKIPKCGTTLVDDENDMSTAKLRPETENNSIHPNRKKTKDSKPKCYNP